jgi:beta-glucosidase
MSSKSIDIHALLSQMTLAEKLGQMSQVSGNYAFISDDLANSVREGKVGSVINEVNLETINELQRIAVDESRLGIPLLIGRDVIHGFNTIFPIPLGQAASWCPSLIKKAARVSAHEASSSGVNWTFSPMIDISRDPRWGRIAEGFGEDTYLCSQLSVAMMKGYQSESLDQVGAIASCAKHFAGYGASESGRDYCTTNIPENELRNTYLPPFKALSDEGITTFMSSFSDLNGIPASANEWLMKDILRGEWKYNGFVVSDWESISQLKIHGLTQDDEQSAFEAANAGIDMEMVSKTYQKHLPSLIKRGEISIKVIDQSVLKILTLKKQLGLFSSAQTKLSSVSENTLRRSLETAKEIALKSCVLLKNSSKILPLDKSTLSSVAVIGPLADDPYEQLGTWIFDGDTSRSVTFLAAIQSSVESHVQVNFEQCLATSRDNGSSQFAAATKVVAQSDVAILVLGEESILSGEAHCRADISLPGAQEELIQTLSATGKPIVLIVMAGRPLTLEPIIPFVDALLYCWHPGCMGGPAIVDLLFGVQSPSGKLPITFPRKLGQIPIYYSQKRSGKPATEESFLHIDDIPIRAEQTSLGMSATHLDTHFSPLYPFGFGLSYGLFEYANITVSHQRVRLGDDIKITAEISNNSHVDCEEVVQLYVRDLVGSVTRPVKELKGFKRIHFKANETQQVSFTLNTKALAFYNRKMVLVTEPGDFHVWIGGCSDSSLKTEFTVTPL